MLCAKCRSILDNAFTAVEWCNSTPAPTLVPPLLCVCSAQPLHHRIFWREETTAASLWEGTRRAIDSATTASGIEGNKNKPPPSHKSDEPQRQAPSSSATAVQKDIKRSKRRSPADTIRDISSASDLQRLALVFNHRRISTSCRETFAAALRDGNPAVIDMWLRHGREHKGSHFLEAFRVWSESSVLAGHGSGQPPISPLHLSCHAGSPEVVSVRTCI